MLAGVFKKGLRLEMVSIALVEFGSPLLLYWDCDFPDQSGNAGT